MANLEQRKTAEVTDEIQTFLSILITPGKLPGQFNIPRVNILNFLKEL